MPSTAVVPFAAWSDIAMIARAGCWLGSGWREPESGFGEMAAGAVMTRFERDPEKLPLAGIVQVKGRMR